MVFMDFWTGVVIALGIGGAGYSIGQGLKYISRYSVLTSYLRSYADLRKNGMAHDDAIDSLGKAFDNYASAEISISQIHSKHED